MSYSSPGVKYKRQSYETNLSLCSCRYGDYRLNRRRLTDNSYKRSRTKQTYLIMGQQHRKIAKRRRRITYLKRQKERMHNVPVRLASISREASKKPTIGVSASETSAE